eukprot:SAG31_NODE_2838_length_5017_cov_3.102074_5_plen_88_part_00
MVIISNTELVATSVFRYKIGEAGVAFTDTFKGMPGLPNSFGLQPCGQYSVQNTTVSTTEQSQVACPNEYVVLTRAKCTHLLICIQCV